MENMNRYGGPAPGDHLVKHENPLVITQRTNPAIAKKRAEKINKTEKDDFGIILPEVPRPDKRESKNRNIMDITSADEILDYILPPRFWVDRGNQYTQKVSRIPATRMEILNLQEKLDVKLEQQKAKETGICPVRRELFAQAFDELIRQATLECAERGLMLLRVRDEIRLTVISYETLFESSMAYGMRKVLLSEQGKDECHSQISDLTSKNLELRKLVNEWTTKFHEIEAKNKEEKIFDLEKKEDELAVLKRTNNQLATVLDKIIVQRTLIFNVGSGLDEIPSNVGSGLDDIASNIGSHLDDIASVNETSPAVVEMEEETAIAEEKDVA